jgi:hypothetical protein
MFAYEDYKTYVAVVCIIQYIFAIICLICSLLCSQMHCAEDHQNLYASTVVSEIGIKHTDFSYCLSARPVCNNACDYALHTMIGCVRAFFFRACFADAAGPSWSMCLSPNTSSNSGVTPTSHPIPDDRYIYIYIYIVLGINR